MVLILWCVWINCDNIYFLEKFNDDLWFLKKWIFKLECLKKIDYLYVLLSSYDKI